MNSEQVNAAAKGHAAQLFIVSLLKHTYNNKALDERAFRKIVIP